MVVSNATLHNEDYISGFDNVGKPIRDGKISVLGTGFRFIELET